MGSGGPGEEALDPRDGMGNGDVEEAGLIRNRPNKITLGLTRPKRVRSGNSLLAGKSE